MDPMDAMSNPGPVPSNFNAQDADNMEEVWVLFSYYTDLND